MKAIFFPALALLWLGSLCAAQAGPMKEPNPSPPRAAGPSREGHVTPQPGAEKKKAPAPKPVHSEKKPGRSGAAHDGKNGKKGASAGKPHEPKKQAASAAAKAKPPATKPERPKASHAEKKAAKASPKATHAKGGASGSARAKATPAE